MEHQPEVAEPLDDVTTEEEVETEKDRRPETKRQPPYHVLLWNDEKHSYEYVIRMLRELFGHSVQAGLKMAEEVDNRGRVIVLTTTREHAELKRDQIHAYGKDNDIGDCQGSMSSTIEPSF